jgi:hypothetical protein
MIILIFLIDYEQELSTTFQRLKKSKISIIDILISLFIILFHSFFFLPVLGFTNPTPLNRNLVPEICKERVYTHIVSTHMHKQNLSMIHTLLATHGVK